MVASPPHFCSEDDVTHSMVRKCILSFPPMSAAGPSGLKPSHLKDVLRYTTAAQQTHFLETLKRFVVKALRGELSPNVRTYLCSARLIPFAKPDGGIRPIAVGEVLRRLVAKVALKLSIQKAVAYLAPLQQGVGVKGAAENIVRYIRLATQKLNSDDVCLQVDITNAFNTVHRDHMLQEVASNFPDIYQWSFYCYSTPSDLICDTHVLKSASGVQQGDTLGPLLFAIALQPIIQSVAAISPTIRQRWFADDGSIVGPFEQIERAIPALTEKLTPIGLQLNRSKSVWWSFSTKSLPDTLGGLRRQSLDDHILLLGVPFGSATSVKHKLDSTLQSVLKHHRQLVQLNFPQGSFELLSFCLSSQKVLYLLRNIPFISWAISWTPSPQVLKARLAPASALFLMTMDDSQCTSQ